MVQMPGDVPVATVAVGGGGARNAGLLAVQILALADAGLQEKFVAFRAQTGRQGQREERRPASTSKESKEMTGLGMRVVSRRYSISVDAT